MSDVLINISRAHTLSPWTFVFLNAARADGGVPMDLTNHAFRLRCENPITKATIFDVNTATGGLVLNAGAGAVTFGMDWSVTKVLTIGKWRFELEQTTPAGQRFPAVRGKVKVIDEVIDD